MNVRRSVMKALQENDANLLNAAYDKDSAGVLRALQMHVYGLNNDIIRWRSITFIGLLSEQHASSEDEVYRNIIRRFIWQMCEESANVPWASPEVIASVIRGAPPYQFNEFIGPLFYHSGLNDICYAGLFWAIGMLANTHGKRMDEFMTTEVYERLYMDDVDIRGYGAWAFTKFPKIEALPYLQSIKSDERVATLYFDKELHEISIADMVQFAINKIQG